MAGKFFGVTFSLVAIVDGEDALSLEANPSVVVWNQEGDVSVDEATGKPTDNSSWPAKYVTVNVRKGDTIDTGWTFAWSISAGSFTVRQGIITKAGDFIGLPDTTPGINDGNTFKLTDPVKQKDSNGKEASTIWTNGTLRLTASKNGKKLTKDVNIALNPLATWQMSVINGTMTAVSRQTEQTLENGYVKKTDYESQIKQTQNEISTKVSQTELGNVAAGEGTSVDIDLTSTGYDEDTFYLVLFDFAGAGSSDSYIFGVKKDLYNYPSNTSYGLHEPVDGKGGFETYLQWQEHYAAWGARKVDRVINSYTKNFMATVDGKETFAVGSIGQYEENGPVYVYLRGGGKYHVYCDHTGMTIHLAAQADLDKIKEVNNADTPLPALSLAVADVTEPVTETSQIYSEIKQTADRISLLVTDLKEKTGIDIQSGVINAIAGMFNFVGSDGKPYIKVEQDSKGYPHLIFYDPTTGDPAYDLGYTGLDQIVNTSQRQYWENMSYINTYAPKSLVYAEEIYRTATITSQAFRYHAAYFIRSKGGTKQFVPAEAASVDNVIYTDMSVDADNIPTASTIPDGWHLVYKKHTYTQVGGTTILPDGSTAKMVDSSSDIIYFNMFYTSGGKISGTTHELAISRLTGSVRYSWGDYTPFIDGVSQESQYFFFPE